MERQIVALLRGRPRKLWSPAEIARELGQKPGSVRKALCRLIEKKNPAVVRVKTGLYRAFWDTGSVKAIETPKPKLHGIQLTQRSPQNRGWGAPGAPAASPAGLGNDQPWTHDPTNGQLLRTLVWQGRAVRVAVSSSTGTVQVNLRAGDDPLSPQEFTSFVTWLDGVLIGQGIVWSAEEAVVSSFEVNLDYRSLWIDEAKRVKLRPFVDGWLQVYQRDPETLRAEARVSPVDEEITLSELKENVFEWAAILHGVRETVPVPKDEPEPDVRPVDPDDPAVI